VFKGFTMKTLILISAILVGSFSIDYFVDNSSTIQQVKEHNAQLECYASINFRG